MITKISLKQDGGGSSPHVLNLRRDLALPDLEIWRDYYIEFLVPPSQEQLDALAAKLEDDVEYRAVVDEPLDSSRAVQVAHKSGIIDNESDSIVRVCSLLGMQASAGKAATTYRSQAAQLHAIVKERYFNPNIEELHIEEPAYTVLAPAGEYLPPAQYDLLAISDESLANLGKSDGRNLSLNQMHKIAKIQASLSLQTVTDVLLEALDARWSDHCSHTTWRAHGNLLGRLIAASEATRNPNIISMFHDNAGVWEFYDGWALAIKAETHNGPSAISAYFGQLTKLGGVLRDIMGTGIGANPIGCYEFTATGLPEEPAPIIGRPGPKQIANETIRAIKEYGNTFGVPMIWSRMTFHRAYRAKPFALGGSIGIIPKAAAHRGTPGPGDVVLLIGGLTGNDGIHGASASSAGSIMDHAAVQIGAPLEQVKFREAILELQRSGLIRAITDLGGAGLNSAVGEMGEACGVWINTALVPIKTSALPMWVILLSESQERMLLAVPTDHLSAAKSILNRHFVRATAIGRFVDTGRYTVFHNVTLDEAAVLTSSAETVADEVGDLGFDVPYDLLHFDPPQVLSEKLRIANNLPATLPIFNTEELSSIVRDVLCDSEVASQLYADAQYDSTVQGNTLYGPRYGRHGNVPTGYWAGTPAPGSHAAVVVTTAFNAWLYEIDPIRALRQLFCRLIGGQVLAGVQLQDICICDNFYTPHLTPNAGSYLVGLVDELASLIRYFGTPVVSGKDSSAGSTYTDEGLVSVPPAVFLTALGKVPNPHVLLPELWQRSGHLVVRIGPETPSAAGTVASRALGVSGGALDPLDLAQFRRYLNNLVSHRYLLRSGTIPGVGGLVACLHHSSLASGLGIELVEPSGGLRFLLEEHRCGAVVEVTKEVAAMLPDELNPIVIGCLSSTPGIWMGDNNLLHDDVTEAWTTSFARRIS